MYLYWKLSHAVWCREGDVVCVEDCEAGDEDDDADGEESYSLLYGNNNWYLLLRLYYILCDRLSYFQSHMEKAVAAAAAAALELKPESVETAYALCLKTPRE